ncbi:CAP domain-containing protein [Ruminococcaceae bacterium OttesenSCG-928-L11]|nr:CAP domain-containing protein [Ruminococcaceae bacterium OttesenSCG-928-L11]
MKSILRTIVTILLASVILTGTVGTAFAAQNPFAYMEAESRKAVEAAIKAGTIPTGTTIYDCAYGADANGNTIVIQYRDKNGNWIDVTTGEKSTSTAAESTSTAPKKDELAAYADRVFELVNLERETAGEAPLQRSDTLNTAAMTRASECASLNSLYVDGKAHTRPDGSQWFTVFGIEKNFNYGENAGVGCTADERMAHFMNSEGHRKNILRSDYTEIGIACAVSETGEIFTVQIFYRP